ncbi:hypothetical protein OG711_08005 [Streptomyces uncialis]|uniref:hypothetical protein n=1 Tax=Streptomyces uncialis TaxID=1048205 RepID=UPI002E37B4A7|nr:hypothetical protein [Streptomyces uncialis]
MFLPGVPAIPDRTPPSISTSRPPRLAVFLVRRYLRACTPISRGRPHPLAPADWVAFHEARCGQHL